MSDTEVISLYYRIEHEASVDYSEAKPICSNQDEFIIRTEGGRVRFTMKEHHTSLESAMKVVEPYIESWELDAALKSQPGEFKLVFDEVIGVPAPVHWSFQTTEPTVTKKRSYPETPDGVPFKLSEDVKLMFNLYEAWFDRKEKLTSIASFCLTMLEKLAGGPKHMKRREKATGRRKKAASKFNIDGSLLNEIGYLSIEKGEKSDARKADAAEENFDLSDDERRLLECAVRAFIQRAAEEAQCPNRSLDPIDEGNVYDPPR